MSITSRVAAGAAVLDKRCPGWEREIDLATLELANSCRCVLGQLYESYAHALTVLSSDVGSIRWASNHGFDAPPHASTKDGRGLIAEYAALDEAWISLIKERFDVGAFSDGE